MFKEYLVKPEFLPIEEKLFVSYLLSFPLLPELF